MAVARPAVHEGARPSGVFTRHDVHGDTVLDCDVVVIGSGAGGATISAELAEAGFDVIVLEEGSYYQTRDFTADASAMVAQLYRDGGATMALGSPPIMYQEGRAVGGSTVINGGMSWRTPENILDRWVKDAKIGTTPREMEPYFARVEKRIHAAPQDPDSIGVDNQLLKRGADALGWNIIGNIRNQVHCVGSNRCAFGCPTGAKQSTLVSYVPRALHFGARVYADVRVERIALHGKRATGVIGRSAGGHHVVVRAKLVVAACGAIHTPALLARSGFRSPSHQLGKNLSMHPNVKVLAIFDEPVTGWKGAHQAYQVREFKESGLVFAAVNMPPSVVAMSLPQRGRALGEIMQQYDRMVLAGMLCEDTATGRVRTIAGRPQAFYQLAERDAANLQRGVSLLSEMLFAAGAKRIVLPFHGAGELATADDARRLLDRTIPARGWEVVTVHMMGTARMGAVRSAAVTDAFGLVHDADPRQPDGDDHGARHAQRRLRHRQRPEVLVMVTARAPEPPPARTLPPFPSQRALALERLSWRELDRVFLCGTTPDLDALAGWEFRGINTRLMGVRNFERLWGIKKFTKGFVREPDGRVTGYNKSVVNNVLDARWHISPKPFGFYSVDRVDPTARDNTFLHALLIDYSRGVGNKRYDLTRGLRDYLVQVDRDDPDLYLGKAFYALGPLRVASNFFILERHRVGLTDYARR